MAHNQTLANQKAIEVADRQRRAVELRKSGASFDEIARHLGYKDASGAYRAVRAALRKTIQQPADELRVLETARLDALMMAIWADAMKGDVAKMDRVLKIMTRRATLLGLDAPTTVRLVHAEAKRIADDYGLSVAEVLTQAEEILREAGT